MSHEASRPKIAQAAFGSLLAWGGAVFLIRTIVSIALDGSFQFAAGHRLGLDRLGIADQALLAIASAVAVALLIIGVALLRGVGRFDRPGPFAGYMAGVMVVFALMGNITPGLAEFIYDGNLDELRWNLPPRIGFAIFFVLVSICAGIWLHIGARRAHQRRLAGLNHPSDGA